ncbi:pyridoxamine 5'-phosphate oxidase family protein [soil metagenome]|jgi:general stress protein 26
MNQNEQQEGFGRLKEKIKDVKVAMMTTAEGDGTLRSRPMHTSEVLDDGFLWFFTWIDSPKAEEIKNDSHVNLSYADPGSNLYVSVSGRAFLTRDRSKIEELWSPFLKAWFPEGKDDPSIGLIRVAPTQAEYWDSSSSKLVQLIGYVKAVATGETYTPDEPDEHKKVNL